MWLEIGNNLSWENKLMYSLRCNLANKDILDIVETEENFILLLTSDELRQCR